MAAGACIKLVDGWRKYRNISPFLKTQNLERTSTLISRIDWSLDSNYHTSINHNIAACQICKTSSPCFTASHTHKMSTRPQNIGIKAIEIYFPSQVWPSVLRHEREPLLSWSVANWHLCSALIRPSLRSSMALAKGNTPLVLDRPRWASAMTEKVGCPFYDLLA